MRTVCWAFKELMKYLTQSLALPDKNDPESVKFQSLSELPLVIIVGLTGVGKSTLVNRLASHLDLSLLPNRRVVTDEVIISSLQAADGQSLTQVRDRLARFEYTARYRQMNPGGMAHALSRLVIDQDRTVTDSLLIFDGLRGLDEVKYAVSCFPRARFVVLDAPDTVRLTRLLDRGDEFDMTAGLPPADPQDLLEALQNITHVGTVFSQSQLKTLAQIAQKSGWLAEEVAQKAAIIVQERRNYNPSAALDFLQQAVPDSRLCLVDTSRNPANVVATRVISWLMTDA